MSLISCRWKVWSIRIQSLWMTLTSNARFDKRNINRLLAFIATKCDQIECGEIEPMFDVEHQTRYNILRHQDEELFDKITDNNKGINAQAEKLREGVSLFNCFAPHYSEFNHFRYWQTINTFVFRYSYNMIDGTDCSFDRFLNRETFSFVCFQLGVSAKAAKDG